MKESYHIVEKKAIRKGLKFPLKTVQVSLYWIAGAFEPRNVGGDVSVAPNKGGHRVPPLQGGLNTFPERKTAHLVRLLTQLS